LTPGTTHIVAALKNTDVGDTLFLQADSRALATKAAANDDYPVALLSLHV
jgi:hypothetical protein